MNAPKRTAYVLKMYPRFSQTFVLNELLAHEAAGWDLDIISMRLSDDTRFHEALARVRSTVIQVPRPPGKAAGLLDQLRATAQVFPNTWEVVADNPEVIASDLQQALALALLIRDREIGHLHAHFGTIATTTARIAARIAGVSYSFTAHAKDIFHASVDPGVLRRKLGDAAAVVTVSRYNLAYLRERYGADASKVVHINNGLPLDEFPFRSPEDREPLILGVGRLVEKKGFAVLIEACAALKAAGRRFRCEIAGGGLLHEELAGRIASAQLGDCVELIGPQPQGEIRRRLHRAAVLAAPCVVAADEDRDGLPTILLEAMAMGTPCVSTDVTGIPEVLRDGETGLAVPQNDAGALAAACATLLDQPGLRSRLAHHARALIEAEFDIAANAARIRELVGRIARDSDA